MYSPDTIGFYIFFKTAGDGWQSAKVVGLAENTESVMFTHTIKMLDWGKRFYVHLRRDQLKTLDVSGDPGNVVLASTSSRKLQVLYIFAVVTRMWKMMEQGIVK